LRFDTNQGKVRSSASPEIEGSGREPNDSVGLEGDFVAQEFGSDPFDEIEI